VGRRNILFLAFSIILSAFYYEPLKELMTISMRNELYSHIILIPLVSGYFLFLKRKSLWVDANYSYFWGLTLILGGLGVYFLAIDQGMRLNRNDHLSLVIFSAVSLWIGGFVFLYGLKPFRANLFPLLFLFFLVPIPTLIVESVILVLQIGSTEASYAFFKLTGVPLLREGFSFHLSGISVEVAKQCSGIRSTIALFITGLIAGHIFLNTGWKKLVLILSIFPITVVKNGLRIVSLSLLGNYVDVRILDSELHKSGGIPFFIVALALLAPVLWALRKSEKKLGKRE
jgi:exosortase